MTTNPASLTQAIARHKAAQAALDAVPRREDLPPKHLYEGKEFASHEYVNHSAGEYGRVTVHTNTLEGFYSVFKRGMKGIYQHCSERHLHRYVAEFDFRYNNRVRLGADDAEHTRTVLRGIVGKRLTSIGTRRSHRQGKHGAR